MFIDFIMALLVSIGFNFPLGGYDDAVSSVKDDAALNTMNVIDARIMSNYRYVGKLVPSESDCSFSETVKNSLMLPSGVDTDGFYYEKLSSTAFNLWFIDAKGNNVYSRNSNRVLPVSEPETF